ncbi:hypothetical protein AURDEDRAFT_161566 [Auricularia subglabra TFB-10046 SS5]|nr:hypothetical protein AURDEDRAFT_161566 [Auricularia subglabra TFB-10046 SS5]
MAVLSLVDSEPGCALVRKAPKLANEAPRRHPIFYYPRDSTIFLVTESNVLLRLSVDQFSRRSPMIDQMLKSAGTASPTEGADDDHPIPLIFGTIEEYEYFLPLIYPQGEESLIISELEPLALLAIYKLTDYYQMEKEQQRCLQTLSSMAAFDPAHKLLASHEFKVHEWRRPAVDALLRLGVDNFSPEQKRRLHGFNVHGLPAYCLIAQLSARIARHRLQVAEGYAEPLQNDNCVRHDVCTEIWQDAWRNGFLPHWLHSSSPCTENDVLDMVNSVTLPRMHAFCLRDTREKLARRFTKEDGMIADAVLMLVNPVQM